MEHNIEQKSTLLNFFSHPLVGIIGTICTIIAIPLSVYFYFSSIESPDLTYFVYPLKTTVFRTDQTSRLSVKFDDKNLYSDISAVNIAFWNAGKRPIHSSDILSPLLIRTSNKAKILEVRLQKTSRNIINVKIDPSKLDNGEIGVRWSILEKNDGALLQIIYCGKESVNILADAIIEGQHKVSKLELPNISPTTNYDNSLLILSVKRTFIFAIIGVISGILSSSLANEKNNKLRALRGI